MNSDFVDQYLRAVAKRALPIFQSNNFAYLGGIKGCVGRIPTENDLYLALKELYKEIQQKIKRCKCLISMQASLGRFTMFYEPDTPLGIKVLLDIDEHNWKWYPEKVFKEQTPQNK